MKFLFTFVFDSFVIVAINDIYDSVRSFIIMFPKRSQSLLTTKIPHCKWDIFVCHFFNIKAYRWNLPFLFPQLKLLQDCGFTSSIKTHHKDYYMLFANFAILVKFSTFGAFLVLESYLQTFWLLFFMISRCIVKLVTFSWGILIRIMFIEFEQFMIGHAKNVKNKKFVMALMFVQIRIIHSFIATFTKSFEPITFMR
jgi:hypothetical protein